MIPGSRFIGCVLLLLLSLLIRFGVVRFLSPLYFSLLSLGYGQGYESRFLMSAAAVGTLRAKTSIFTAAEECLRSGALSSFSLHTYHVMWDICGWNVALFPFICEDSVGGFFL